MTSLGTWSTCEDVVREFKDAAADMKDATVVVTGSSAGIGEEAAYQLAVLGATVICAVRNVQKGTAAVDKMRARAAEAKHAEALKLHVLPFDCSDLRSVPIFMAALVVLEADTEGGLPPLRYLLNNAGIGGYPSATNMVSAQGHDLLFATNHLGHFALTQALLPRLRQHAPSRIVVVSSDSHYMPAVTAKELASAETLRAAVVPPKDAGIGFAAGLKVYGDSKLLNVLHAMQLHAREKDNGVTTTVLHPGNLITTSISDNAGAVGRFLFKNVIGWFTKSVNQGTATTLYCTLATPADVAGKYHSSCNAKPASKLVTPEAGEVLWQLSTQLVAESESGAESEAIVGPKL